MCTFAIQTVICGYITGNESDTIYVVLRSPDPGQNSGCTGAIASASFLAVIFFMCGVLFTIIFFIMLAKLRKNDRHSPTCMKHELPDSNYEVVKHHESSTGGINTRKNVAYGQVHA